VLPRPANASDLKFQANEIGIDGVQGLATFHLLRFLAGSALRRIPAKTPITGLSQAIV